MITFAMRRWRNILLFLLCAFLCWVLYYACVITLSPTNFYTGWILLALMIVLALYNARKKLTFLPFLGKSSTWLQFHIYVGLLTMVIFALHVNFRVPNGILDIVLSLLFLSVVLSGVFGIVISRYFPKALNLRGETVLYERIPIYLRQVRDAVEELAVGSVEKTKQTTIADFYRKTLAPYFSGPKNFFYHLVNSRTPYLRLMNEIDTTERYLNKQEQAILTEIKEWVEAKERLDYHYALQGALKGWLFVHIPLTYSLMIISFYHAILMYAFYGGV